MTATSRSIRIAFPIVLLALCAFLWTHIARKGAALDAVPNAVGPGGWPRAMLLGLAVFAVLTLIAELLAWRHAVRTGGNVILKRDVEAESSQGLAFVGIALILGYGFAIPYLGFAFATAAFLLVWCLLGRVRSLLTVGLVSVLGTVVLLYMFVALARMPLNRGVEPFNSTTIALYRLLRIY